MKTVLIATFAAAILFGLTGRGLRSSCAGTPNGASHMQAARSSAAQPPVMLWAWQRPEDLRFIDPRRTGVSFLAETIKLTGSGITVQPNLERLKVPEGVWLMACARIEAESVQPPALSSQQRDETVSALSQLVTIPGVKALQVDFDAAASERVFYRSVLTKLRRQLPPSTHLSITALASWCMGDDWISSLPLDEAVPMLFRMGPDRRSILFHLQTGGTFDEPLCRKSVGISTDEFIPRLAGKTRLYIFNPSGWSREALERALAKARR